MFYCDCRTHENYENFCYSDWKIFCTECHAQLKVKCSICWKMFKSSKVRGREQYHLTHEYKCTKCILKNREIPFLLGKITDNINNYIRKVYSNCFDQIYISEYRGNSIYIPPSILNTTCTICAEHFQDGFNVTIWNKINTSDNCYYTICYKCCIDRIIADFSKISNLWELESLENNEEGKNQKKEYIPKYHNYYQWLPREVSEDITELVIWRE